MKLRYWLLAFLFVAGFILCAQDPLYFPWAWLAGLSCFAALGWIANKLQDEKQGARRRAQGERVG